MLPSTGVKELFHVWPPSIEYSSWVPASTPDSDRLPSEVIRSAPLDPVSLASDKPGLVGARVSSVNSNGVPGDTPPLPSNWRTRTTLPPSTAVNSPLQVCPASSEYSIPFPISTPVTNNAPSEVTASAVLVPVSFPSDTIGATNTLGRIVLTIPTPGSTSV